MGMSVDKGVHIKNTHYELELLLHQSIYWEGGNGQENLYERKQKPLFPDVHQIQYLEIQNDKS